ncbi:alcohol dehydrogenase catalytic domain-containing protein [Microbacterium sp. H1-D42]|uniref:alcohol dehydrogenase catalytic domain-containing protein n=1 Tax=Microbacterium sp. H1-D42 TaxID=2925844 RepID=UPI001F52CEDF|nr:alcohol dehydrogenase catalytic domain-containing protein [Microbacterium sp. H1-D42]UNK71530.1 alcohol dehydrogenase catalytic domain-containing protein [Microbacterium sp. H1-D42]
MRSAPAAPLLPRRSKTADPEGRRTEERRTDVVLRPAAVAMAFIAPEQPHEPIAVPGVALAADDVLVAIEMSTICGSDVHTVHGRRSAPAPLVLGHESVGRVIAIGSAGVDAADGTPVRIGDRVVWSVTVSCGRCDRCTTGLTQKCRELGKYGHERIAPHRELTGGFASHAQLRRGTTIVRVPETLPAAVLAPASCATATAWAAVQRGAAGRDLSGMRVRVYGAGLVGLSAAAIAESQGAIVDVADPNPLRRAAAERFGAVSAEAIPAAVHPETVHPETVHPEPEIVIEASGHAVAQAAADVAVGGTVVLVGSVFPADPVPLDAESLVRRMITITGIHNYTGADLADAVSFLAVRGRAYPFAEVVGTVHPLVDLDAALRAASAPDAPLRVGIIPR